MVRENGQDEILKEGGKAISGNGDIPVADLPPLRSSTHFRKSGEPQRARFSKSLAFRAEMSDGDRNVAAPRALPQINPTILAHFSTFPRVSPAVDHKSKVGL